LSHDDMNTVQAIYEGGVFRPIGKVDLPEGTRVEFEPRMVELEQSDATSRVFEILSESFDSGRGDLAARHNEHQP
jgi:predicted DNA-binding antitoxin AbrB/MazE fold protein